MLKRHLRQFWLILSFVSQTFLTILAILDLEASTTSSWRLGDWSTNIKDKEMTIEDRKSGCICRFRSDEIICYGSRTCNEFPVELNFQNSSSTFLLKTTGIRRLRSDAFINLKHVRILEIDANYQLSLIEPGIFSHMENVETLSISFNPELKTFRKNVFDGLKSLASLTLRKNGFQSLLSITPALSPDYLPRLLTLALSQNNFKTIYSTDFVYMVNSSVEELNLYACLVQDLDTKALNVFKNLKTLRIGGNSVSEETLMTMFEELYETQIPLNTISLFHSSFRKPEILSKLLETISKLNVTHLVLAKNHIESIYPGFFPYMKHLRILNLREASIVDIDKGALDTAFLPKLDTLYLTGNRVPGFIPGVLLPHLTELDLSGNTGNEFHSSYFDVASERNFENMTRLNILNLSFNRIVSITNSSFQSLDHLKTLGLKNATIFYISDHSFSMLPSLELLNLDANPFKPFNELRGNLFTGLIKLEILYLQHCKISSIHNPYIFEPLVNLKYLSMTNNIIKQVDPILFQPLCSLVGLDLSYNFFEPWRSPIRIFNNNTELEVLRMSFNRFTYVSKAMMRDFKNLKRLDIDQNPYICDCVNFQSIQTWLHVQNITVYETSLINSSNQCVSPDIWRNKLIVDFITKQNCALSLLQIIIPFVFISMVLLSFILLYYRYRWHIRYWIFLIKLFLLPISQSSHCQVRSGFKYDAFVSYSNEDRNFIIRLVAMLENYEPYYKLCVYERDFQVGTMINASVLESVQNSRKVLLVVSDSFVKSYWCTWEMHLAKNHTMFFDPNKYTDDSLVIIKLGPIATKHITPTLRYLLKTRIYLEWNDDPEKQRIFWKKLRMTLAGSQKY